MIKTVERLYRLLISVADNLRSPFLLAVRLYWGWQFIQTGIGHLNHLDKVIPYFGELGIPAPGIMAPMISMLELGGGILLVLGLASRLIALMLTGNMLVAFITGDRAALFSMFSDPDKFYAAAPYTFLIASLIVLIFGAGLFAVDTLIAKKFQAKPVGARAHSVG